MGKLKFWARHVLIDLRSTSVAKDTITLNDSIDPYGFAPPRKKASCVISAPTAMVSLYQKPQSNRRSPLPAHWQLLQNTRKYKKMSKIIQFVTFLAPLTRLCGLHLIGERPGPI